MSIAPLFLLFALGADRDPRLQLVAKLGSAEPAVQAAASESLKALGVAAIPALERAISASDTELGKRASALWDTIQRELMARPSMVRLDKQYQTIEDVLEDLAKQTGMSMRMTSNHRNQAAAVHEPAPITFWTAINRLGIKSLMLGGGEHGKFPSLEFQVEPHWQFVSAIGLFRVALTGLHLHRDRQLIRGPWVRLDRFQQRVDVGGEDLGGDTVTYYGGLEVTVEPRSLVHTRGAGTADRCQRQPRPVTRYRQARDGYRHERRRAFRFPLL